MKVTFYYRETYPCGDGCCTLVGDDVEGSTREVTVEQLAKLKEEVDGAYLGSFYTEDFGIGGEDEHFTWYCEVD